MVTMASGPGRTFSDGIFSIGVPQHSYPGANMRSYADGVLGAIVPAAYSARPSWQNCDVNSPGVYLRSGNFSGALRAGEHFVDCMRRNAPAVRRGRLSLPTSGLGATICSGEGRSFRDGIFSTADPVAQAGRVNQQAFADGVLGALGATMASGPGRTFSDGIFSIGVPQHSYPGANMRSYADGVLGALGAVMASGPGHSYRGGLFDTPFNEYAARDGVLGQYAFYDKASPAAIAAGVAAVVGLGALGWWALRKKKR